jgi:uncharacterized protein YutE (UPF0331/DUF86 family)
MTPGPINRLVVADKVDVIRRMLDGARSVPLQSLADFTADPRMVAAGDSYLRRALEALLDLARHVLAKGFARAPAEYAEVARQLGEVGVIDAVVAARFGVLARCRNRMVHFYDEITESELFGILTAELGDIETIVAALIAWFGANPDRMGESE